MTWGWEAVHHGPGGLRRSVAAAELLREARAACAEPQVVETLARRLLSGPAGQSQRS